MDRAELFDALDGLLAWDEGAVDSGIEDKGGHLRRRVVEYLKALSREDCGKLLNEWINEYCLSDIARADGYGEEDAAEFKAWITHLIDYHYWWPDDGE